MRRTRHLEARGVVGVVDLLPALMVVPEICGERRKRREQPRLDNLRPGAVRDPVCRFLGRLSGVDAADAREQEAQLRGGDFGVGEHQARAHQERVEHFVLLEERAAHVAVERVGEELDEEVCALLDIRVLLRIVHRSREQKHEPIEGVLVHGLDVPEVRDTEEQQRPALGVGSVAHARVVDGRFCLLGCLQGHADLVGCHLGGGEGVDQLLVLENVTARLRQHFEDLVLDLGELLLEARVLDHKALPLLFQIVPLYFDRDAEELVLQADRRDRKVDKHHFRRDLRGVVGGGELGSEVQLEVVVILDDRVADVDAVRPPRLVDALGEERFEDRVDRLSDVLEEHRPPVLYARLDVAHEVRLRELVHPQVVVLLHVPDPLVRLELGIHAQGPAAPARDHHAVLCREAVRREPLDVPRPHVRRIREEVSERVGLARRDLELLERGEPRRREQVHAVLGVEGPAVGQEGRRDGAVPDELGGLGLEVGGRGIPPRALAAQPAHEALRAVELGLELGGLGDEALLEPDGLVVLVLEREHLVRHRLQLVLRGLELGTLLGESLHRLLELGLLRRDILRHPPVHHHRAHPHAQRLGGARLLPDEVGVELRLVGPL
mmetsp:Transcript_11097/g.26039  ORF Transcript_11097/g.26039 Transcript_11097/m.26039 type:complete len:607 (-) Transcript_11097:345-2165(-)